MFKVHFRCRSSLPWIFNQSRWYRSFQDRIDAIRNYPRPNTVKELRRFLGFINFYRRLLKGPALIQAPLHELTAGATKRDNRVLAWTSKSQLAFEQCKRQLEEATLLAHPKEGAPLVLQTDVSDTAIDAALQQLQGNVYVPLSFFSQKLSDTQKKYSTYDCELLAVYKTLKYFRHLVEGRECTVATDHKSLVYAFYQKSDRASPRQLRQLDYILQFTTHLVHLPRTQNTVAEHIISHSSDTNANNRLY